jgi:hypothetical protein
MSGFSQEQMAKIIKALEEKGAILPCPRCGNQTFSVLGGYFNQTVQSDLRGLVIGGSSVPTVVVVVQDAVSSLNMQSPHWDFFLKKVRLEMSEQKPIITEKALLDRLLVDVKSVNFNVSQDLIVTTEDKVSLCLKEHLEYVEKKRAWVTPLGIFLTIIATLVTTTFKDVGLSADTWQAIFIIIGVLSFGWFISAAYKSRKARTIEDIIKKLKATPSP